MAKIYKDCFHQHTSILVGDDVYIWGGKCHGLPIEHDVPAKKRLLSSVNVYNVLNSSLEKRPTTGTPPNGAIGYASCCIGEDIYYFGGWCGDGDCIHNNLLILNTKRNRWRWFSCDNPPMKKFGCGMIPFCIDGDDYLLLIGGQGPRPHNPSPHAQYERSAYDGPYSWLYTNEVHIMCVSTTPGKWKVPKRTGSAFPPSSVFSINTFPGNRAIIFGGQCMTGLGYKSFLPSGDVFIVSYTNNAVDFQKLNRPWSDCKDIPWPEDRQDHSSVVISSVSDSKEEKHYLVVLGGCSVNERHTANCWLMEVTSNDQLQWKQISLPEVVTRRHGHSMSCYNISDHCKRLIISGGVGISSPNKLMIVEIVFSPTDDNWTVTNVLNEEDMKNTTKCTELSDRLSEQQDLKEQGRKENPKSILPVTKPHKGLLNTRGEKKVQLLKQLKQGEQEPVSELSLIQKRLEDEKKAHDITKQQKDRQDVVIQLKGKTIQLKDVQLQEKDELLQQYREIIQQKDASIQQQQARISEEIKKFELLQREKESLSQQKKAMAHEAEQSRKEKEALQQEMQGRINQITKQQDQKYERFKQDETALHKMLDGKERELNALKTRTDHEIKRYKLLQKERDMISQEMKDMAHRLTVDDLCDVMRLTAYIQHQWEELGRVLRVPLTELQRIASKDCSVTRSHYDTLRYWIVRVGGSWKGLVDALKHKDIGQKELSDKIDCDHAKIRKRQTILLKDHKQIAQYNDLLPYNIFSHVDWMVLGIVLGLDDETLEQIETSHRTDDTRAQVMVDKWINTGQAYWSLIVDALNSPIFGETKLANQIAKDELGTQIQHMAIGQNVNMQAGADDGNLSTEGAYEINRDAVKEMKEEILKKLTNAALTLGSQPRGIIYAFAMTEVKGARVDLTTIANTFEKDLRFAVYPVEDISGAKLANLIKAAATVDYPRFCKHICFYFSGHGGIRDKRPFFKPKADKDGGKCFFIRENILVHFGEKKSRPKDKFIFFFDCCLSQSPDDKTPAEVGFFLEAPVRCLIAYATAVGVKAYGDTEKGGRWTSILCEHLKEQVELGEALAKTHNVVMKLSNNKQPSHYRSCIGPVYLKGMPEKQTSTTSEEESKNILRRHRSDLYETLHNDPTDLISLATALSMDGIIDRVLEDEVKRGRGKKEVVGKFLDKLEKKAEQHPICLPKLLEKMAHFDGTLGILAKALREEGSNDEDQAITTGLYEDLNKCKAENEVLKQKLETLDKELKKQVTNLKKAYSEMNEWKYKMTTVIDDLDKL